MILGLAAGLLFACHDLLQVTAFDDASRLGKYITGIPIYRTIGNTNAVQVSLEGQNLNLTLCELFKISERYKGADRRPSQRQVSIILWSLGRTARTVSMRLTRT